MDPVADSIESLDRPYLHGSSASSLLRFTFGKDDPATQLADHLKFIRLYLSKQAENDRRIIFFEKCHFKKHFFCIFKKNDICSNLLALFPHGAFSDRFASKVLTVAFIFHCLGME